MCTMKKIFMKRSTLLNLSENLVERLKRAITSRSAGVIINGVFPRMALLAISMSVARTQDPLIFSQFTIAFNTLNIFILLASAGFSQAFIFFSRVEKVDYLVSEKITAVISANFLFSILSAMLMLTCNSGIAELYGSKGLSNTLIYVSAICFFLPIQILSQSILINYAQLARAAKISLVFSIYSFLIFISALHFFSYRIALASLVICYALDALLNGYFAYRELRKNNVVIIAFSIRSLHQVLMFTFPILMSSLLVAPTHWLATSILSRNATSASEVAVYLIAYQWFSIVAFIPNMLSRIYFVDLSAASVRMDIVKKSILNNMKWVGFVCIALSILSPIIMSMYGYAAYNSYLVFIVMMLSIFISALLGPVGQYLIIENKSALGFICNLVWAAVFLLSSFFIVDHDALGISLALLFSYAVAFFVNLIVALRIKK